MFDITIMAHPARTRQVAELAGTLGSCSIVEDTDGDVWSTGRAALLHNNRNRWSVVIQDDSIVGKRFTRHLFDILCAVEDMGHEGPVSLYMGRQRTRPPFQMSHIGDLARRYGASFARFSGPWWGQAIAVPTVMVKDAVAYGDSHPELRQYDWRITHFFGSIGVDCLYTLPSIVEHRTGVDEPSLLGHGSSKSRRALWFDPDPDVSRDGVVTPDMLEPRLQRKFPGLPKPKRR